MAAEGLQLTYLPDDQRRGAFAFAALFALESFARALCASVITVQAHDLLNDNQKVSTLFLVVGIGGLLATLTIPYVIAHSARRWVYTAGAVGLMLASALLATHTLSAQAAGMLVRVIGTACLNITLSLYILDHIRRQELVRSEPMRLALSAVSWTVGPYLGVYLYENWDIWVPFALSAVSALALLALFWVLRLTETVIRPARQRPANPLANIDRFVKQPRLRLAWVIAFGRSCFWSSFFIYGPLLMITGGVGKEAGGLLVSLGQVGLASAWFFGRVAQKAGVRRVVAGSFGALALTCIAAGLAGTSYPLIAGACLLAGSIAGSSLDGVGGIPFLRAVKTRERVEMSGVYRTYNDMSDLVPSLIFSVLLLFLPLGAVFVTLGLGLLVITALSWVYLPKSL
jgi:predicted MFS family arabinose efflux permease